MDLGRCPHLDPSTGCLLGALNLLNVIYGVFSSMRISLTVRVAAKEKKRNQKQNNDRSHRQQQQQQQQTTTTSALSTEHS